MNCPVCGKEMRAGKIFYQSSCGLHFLPTDAKPPYRNLSKRRIQAVGGIPLDGPNNLGLLQSDGTLPASICEACRKVVVEY